MSAVAATSRELTPKDSAGRVSVVIPTYNRRAVLRSVVEPLLGDGATLEVIVVVDGCHDGSYELVQELARADARVRPVWRANGGAAAAREAGARMAGGEILLFLDDDVVADERLVSGHLDAHQGLRSTVVLGYMPPALPARRLPGQVATYLYEHDYELVCAAYERDRQQILLNLWAGNFSMRREDALLVGMSAPHDLSYHADKQLGYRCRSAGLEAVFRRDLRATHRHERTVEQFRRELRRQSRDRSWFAREHPELEGEGWLIAHPPVLLRALALPGVSRICLAVLLVALELAGRAHLWVAENLAARLVRQIELLRSSGSALTETP